MKNLKSIFQSGLKVVVPFLFTLFLLYWLFVGVERFFRWFLLLFIGESYYFTGLGWISVILLTVFFGLTIRITLIQKAIERLQKYLLKIPLINTLYNTASDLMSLFTRKHIKEGEVVMLKTPIGKVIGIVTQSRPDKLPGGIGGKDEIAVYVQMSYNFGGYTFIIPKDSVETLDLSVQEAVALTMTACVSANKEKS